MEIVFSLGLGPLAAATPLEPLVDPRDPALGLGAMQDADTMQDIRIDLELEIKMGRTEIKFINLLTLDMTHERLEKIRNIAKQYTLAMDRLTRSRYYPYLEEKYKQQFAADEKISAEFS